MKDTAVTSALTSVREVQIALSRLRESLGVEVKEEALIKYIEAIESAETMTQSLVELLGTQSSPVMDSE